MATYTTNYNLEKPAQTDIYNVDVFNANADKIDAGLTDKAEKTMLAPVETTNSASRSYAKGEYFVYNNVLCCATTAIAAGGTIAIGTNCSTAPVGGELKSLRDALSPMTNSTGHVSIFDGTYATFTLDGTNYSNADVRICGLRYESADGLNVLSIGKMISTSNGNLWKYVEGNNVSGALFVTFKRNGTWSSTGWHVIGG